MKSGNSSSCKFLEFPGRNPGRKASPSPSEGGEKKARRQRMTRIAPLALSGFRTPTGLGKELNDK
jgi:hypothetical protein